MLWHSTPASRGLSPKPPAGARRVGRPTAHPTRGRKGRVPRQPGPADRQTEPSRAAESLPASPINKAPCAYWPPHHPPTASRDPKVQPASAASPRLRDQRPPSPPSVSSTRLRGVSARCQLPLLQECPLLNPGLVPGPLLRRSGALPSLVTPSKHQTCMP